MASFSVPFQWGLVLSESSEEPYLPRWTTWKEASEVFQVGGVPPGDWSAPRKAPLPLEDPKGQCNPQDKETRFLFIISSSAPRSALDSPDAYGNENPVWDQNGSFVYYEALMNDRAFKYIQQNRLYSRDGQRPFRENPEENHVAFPSGVYWNKKASGEVTKFTDPEKVGAMTLKLAWKVLNEDKGDIPGRFFTSKACIPTKLEEQKPGNKWVWTPVRVGLVGMHIAHKTLSSHAWVWSTFEHVDNVKVQEGVVRKLASLGKKLKPSFHRPDCQEKECPDNVPPHKLGIGTQVIRERALLEDTQQLNKQVQGLLEPAGSVWQYYELIDTQWPARPRQELNGGPTPELLANSVMETYIQKKSSCMGCHFHAAVDGKTQSGDYVRVLERAQ